MKNKIVSLTLLLTLVAAANVFAATGDLTPDSSGTITYPTSGVGVGLTFTTKVSANVLVSYLPETAGLAYSLATWHTSGNKTYGTSSNDTRIYMFNNADQTSPQKAQALAGTGAAATPDFGTWTAVK